MKPYESCETCPRCYSGKCRRCPKNRAELAEFRARIEGKVSRMAAVIWHPRNQRPTLLSSSTEQDGGKACNPDTTESTIKTPARKLGTPDNLQSSIRANRCTSEQTIFTSSSTPSRSLKKTQAGLSDLTFPVGVFPACVHPNDLQGTEVLVEPLCPSSIIVTQGAKEQEIRLKTRAHLRNMGFARRNPA